MVRASHLMILFMATVLPGTLGIAPAWAGPAVQFDVGYLVPAEDITTPAFQIARPGYRLMHVELMISTMVDSRVAEDLIETTFTLEPHNPHIQIEDFSPQTTLQSPYAGNISQEERTELDLSTKLGANHLISPGTKGDASITAARKHALVEKKDILPELRLVTASGTIHRGRGVYFRFNRTKQTSLEGTTAIAMMLAVPEEWSADTLTVRCTGKFRQAVVPGGPSHETSLPESRYTVATYRMGDRHAAQVAARYVRAEAHWQQVKSKFAKQIASGRRDSPLDYLTAIVRPTHHQGSVEQLLTRSPKEAKRQLPPPVIDAYYRLRDAEAEINACGGTHGLRRAEIEERQPIANAAIAIDAAP